MRIGPSKNESINKTSETMSQGMRSNNETHPENKGTIERPGNTSQDKPSQSKDSNQELKELNRQLLKELTSLNHSLRKFNKTRRHIILSLTGGITRGLGAAFGATIIFAIILGLLAQLLSAPFVGGYIKRVVEFVQEHSGAGSALQFNGVLPDVSPTQAPTQATPKTNNPQPAPDKNGSGSE